MFSRFKPKQWLSCFFIFACIFQLSATTISPFPNLGEMTKNTETVVLAKALRNITVENGQTTKFQTVLEVVDNVKGSLSLSEQFAVQNYHTKIGDLERMVWGDLELEEGKTYLLFLNQIDNNLWQTTMLSYAAFEMQSLQGQNLLIPFDLGKEVHFHIGANQDHPEPLAVYKAEELLAMLKSVDNNQQVWDRQEVATKYDPNSFEAGFRGTPPGHCSFLSGGVLARWPDFETTSLPITHHEDEDPGCATTPTEVADAIGAINGSYLGVNLANSGTHNFVPTCMGEGANDTEFIDHLNNNMGGSRNLLIQFDDPCSEITDLVGCNGTLAIGGLYWFSSTHTADGMTWRNAGYGYVVVNNGTGACQCGSTDYEIMLTHEMSHSLNIGHIAAGSGGANMNPSCCNTITALDIQCLDFIYSPAPTPVEVTRFTGKSLESEIQLDWISLSETNNDHYILERLTSQGDFRPLGKIAGAGTSLHEAEYQYLDKNPEIGTNYYRLSQKDFDGTTKVIDQIAVEFYSKLQLTVSPNPFAGDDLQLKSTTDSKGTLQIEIFNLTGEVLLQDQINLVPGVSQTALSVANLSNGVFILRATQNNITRTIRIVKSE